MADSELDDSTDVAERRKALEKFAAANPDVPQGLTWGMAGNILIGRFRDPAFVRGLQKTLRKSNIPSMLKITRYEAAVYVPELHRSNAFDVLSRYQKERPHARESGWVLKRRYDLYFLYGIVVFGSVSLFSYYHSSRPLWFFLIFTCVAVAWLFDRSQTSVQWYGRHRFRLLDMLIIFFVIAMFCAAINFRLP